jgi:aspartyl aminopeptidase
MVLEKFVQFVDRSPTVYQACQEISASLKEAGFTLLSESEEWKLEPGRGYFLTREETLLAAFRMPKQKPEVITLLASHTDSPALRLKPQPESGSHEIGLLSTELYGGPLLYTWLDRDLAIAGRILFLNRKGKCESKLVYLDDSPVFIPSLAIHLNREVNEKGIIVHKQDHLKAVFTLKEKKQSLEERLKKIYSFEKLLGFDLFLVPLEKPRFNGFDGELLSAYRIDNLSSAFACLAALTDSKVQKETLQMAVFWDHEEIGSKTYAGADSLFMNELFDRICHSSKLSREDYYRMKSRSLCLSCDVGHAFHPNYSDKNEPQNSAYLGKGPCIKFSSRYATTGGTAAPIVRLAQKRKIPLQMTASRSDLSSGGTVGAMMGASPGIPTLDLGIACWAMHSTRETIAGQDLIWLCELLKATLNEPL